MAVTRAAGFEPLPEDCTGDDGDPRLAFARLRKGGQPADDTAAAAARLGALKALIGAAFPSGGGSAAEAAPSGDGGAEAAP